MRSRELCTDAERATLDEWSFSKDFERGRQHLTTVTRAVYQAAINMGTSQLPDQYDLARILNAVLKEEPFFRKIVVDKLYISPAREPVFVDMFSRYVVAELWQQVVGG